MQHDELARDDRFFSVGFEARQLDARRANRAPEPMAPSTRTGPDQARSLMHGIMVGEMQAMEGAGRTCWDFADDDLPFAFRLDMARQTWDESRHMEISVWLMGHMGVELGEYAENTILFEASCNADPVLRLTGVNRALEGLAIDVFNMMKEFGEQGGDPVMQLCEDWMLADEVTHVKMGSDWLRRLSEGDKERRDKALEFQRTVDQLFNFRGSRGDEDDAAAFFRLSRRFRRLAGFSDAEIDSIRDDSLAARAQARAEQEAGL